MKNLSVLGHPPAAKADEVPVRQIPSVYPEPFASRMKNRSKRQLGNYFGIQKFGVNLTELAPGGEASLLHKHTLQEEFIFVLSGHPTLVLESEEVELSPGMCAGFVPSGPAHTIVNRTSETVRYLEVGDREAGDQGIYPTEDLVAKFENSQWQFTRKNGSAY